MDEIPSCISFQNLNSVLLNINLRTRQFIENDETLKIFVYNKVHYGVYFSVRIKVYFYKKFINIHYLRVTFWVFKIIDVYKFFCQIKFDNRD